MNILIIGNGAREYSIALALKKDKRVNSIFFAPGNGATENLGKNIEYKDYEELIDFVKKSGVDLTVVGPEKPLTDGVVDMFRAAGLPIFGPAKKPALLEGSKAYMKEFAKRYNLPSARFIRTDSISEATEYIHTMNTPIVVKADGLCAGKGVIIAQSHKEAVLEASKMLSGEAFGDAGKTLVIEEFLDGYELSVFALSDGSDYVVLPACQDHKRLLDNDEGPNTGGMGAYTPTPLADEVLMKKIDERIIKPAIDGMKSEGSPFSGVLFCGIMVVKNEPFLLEFNVRFGDPECEVLMPLLEESILDILEAGAKGNIKNITPKIAKKHAVGVVIASREYPYASSEPAEITVNEKSLPNNAHVSYAGVSKKDGKLYATGGRVLVCVGVADTLKDAKESAYKACECVSFDGMQYRKDISYRAFA